MPYVGFEPTFPASERAKTVYALDRAATVTGFVNMTIHKVCLPYEPQYVCVVQTTLRKTSPV
jgi:hypothetical protein